MSNLSNRHPKSLARPTIDCESNEVEVVVTDDKSRTLRRKKDWVTWHSESGAMTESLLVFLRNSNVHQNLKTGKTTSVLEVGFGTGLNFFLTSSLAENCKTTLNYLAFEPKFIPKQILDQLQYGQQPNCQPGFRLFANKIFARNDCLRSDLESDFVKLKIVHQSIDSEHLLGQKFDAIYHDPFSPEVAKELWAEKLFAELHQSLVPEGRLVTYCVKSEIQRRLKSVGFTVSKTAGPMGGKREVLIAQRNPTPAKG